MGAEVTPDSAARPDSHQKCAETIAPIDNYRLWEVDMSRATSIVHRKPSPPRAGLQARSAAIDAVEPDQNLRESGLAVMGDMPWGTHICVFYQTKQDLLDTVVSYFEAGLKNNESCVWAISNPITVADATAALRREIADFDCRLAAGQIELVEATGWYLGDGKLDPKKIFRGWSEKLQAALAKGYEGTRVSGNAFWIATDYWRDFCAYEEELNQALADQKIIALCTYSLQASRAMDILDVARVHQCSMARRNGDWEFMETPELRLANREIRRMKAAIDILSKPSSAQISLTPRERVTLAQIVRGASSKEAARTLGISPRTVEFHRANVMQKLGARNTADLVRRLLGE
jgi:DNA-binding CsgD family transcriptional regulator